MDLSQRPTLASLTETIKQVQTSQAVRDKINLAKILAFFDTALGQEILANTDRLYREQPFSMLKRDQKSQEDFVVRGSWTAICFMRIESFFSTTRQTAMMTQVNS